MNQPSKIEEELCIDCNKEERNPGLNVCGSCYHERIWGNSDEN